MLRRFCMSFSSNKNHILFFHSWNLGVGTCDASLVRGELGSTWETSGEHLGIWDLGSIWDASGKHLWASGTWEASGKHLGSIREASTLGFPPWSSRCWQEEPGFIACSRRCWQAESEGVRTNVAASELMGLRMSELMGRQVSALMGRRCPN